MDNFDDLFDVFSSTTPISSSSSTTIPSASELPQPKRALTEPTTPATPQLDVTKRSKTTTTTGDANALVSLATDNEKQIFNILPSQGATKTSAETSSEDYDVFNGYYEQVIVGTDKPENVQDQTQKTCAMQTCYPPLFHRGKYDKESHEAYVEKISNPKYEPAKKYPFTLDPFQAKAVQCIEKNQSVLVAAHTSAGKTVVAEYSIALSLKLGQRVIYTSPIKALSNQKYRELQAEFTDVGLMTGDVTINPTASCLVMTTEILRNMLYRGSEVLREISWVIFDEVHYMRDRSRGVVWEETIILLPHKCRFVFLSATLLNSAEFACWVAKIHNQPCSVIYTNYRPTPLEHFVCARGSDGIHLIVDKHGEFRDGNFQKALSALSDSSNVEKDDASSADKPKKKKGGSSTSEDEVEIIVRKVKELELDPCIVFSFSKKDCQRYAKAMMKIDFCTGEERELISEIYKRAVNGLTEQDRKLPQVVELAPLLKQGIGIHHGGLLPILKEVVELLFQEGLIRVLFSTETFSIGLNMPARTVIFTSMFKWDGMAHRALTSGEYIQMSGRAGRRGLDDRGVVILMLNQEIETNVVKAMMAGPSDPLMSSFKLGYNMLLNLVRLEEARADHLMLRSFYQFQQQRAVPLISSTIAALETQRTSVIESIKDIVQRQILLTMQTVTPDNALKTVGKGKKAAEKTTILSDYKFPLFQIEDVQHYYALKQNLNEQRQILRSLLHRPEMIRAFFETTPGRLVNIKACLREGPPPFIGSAAALALLDAYNQPIVVSNHDSGIMPLQLEPALLEGLAVLRANRGILDGDNQNQSQNAEATSKALIRADDIHQETGLIPPGLGLSHGRLAQLASTNKTSFVDVQRRRLKDQELSFGWGIVLHVSKRSLPECVLYGSQTPIPASTGQEKTTERNATKESREVTIFDVLLPVDPDTVTDTQLKLQPTSTQQLGSAYALHTQTRPCPPGKSPKYIIVPMLASAINAVSSVCVPKVIFKSPQDRLDTGHRLEQIAERFAQRVKEAHPLNPLPSNLPLVSPILDYTVFDPSKTEGRPQMAPLMDTIYPLVDLFSELKIWDVASHSKGNSDNQTQDTMTTDFVRDIVSLNLRVAKLHQQMTSLKLHNQPLRDFVLSQYYHKVTLDGYRMWLNYKLGVVSRDKTLAATLVAMHRVLRNLQLISADDVITNKGRVACELSTCDELVGTELMYSSMFNQLDVKQIAALCSCLVFDEGSLSQEDRKPKLHDALQVPYNQLEEHLKHVATVVKETNIPIDMSRFMQSFNPFLMNIVYQWCEGATFATIMKNSNGIFEGTIVRVMRRLEELLRQFAVAAATLGNSELEQKFTETIQRIKRDIIFAASLYL